MRHHFPERVGILVRRNFRRDEDFDVQEPVVRVETEHHRHAEILRRARTPAAQVFEPRTDAIGNLNRPVGEPVPIDVKTQAGQPEDREKNQEGFRARHSG